ncbi:MAG TPA: hypothetical protein VHW66_02695 [Stellaceae bacterium]|jgi:hypothetical protein|nr:hypothetical protein [Stellaceae bacterium]
MTQRRYTPTRPEVAAALASYLLLPDPSAEDLQDLLTVAIPHGSLVEALSDGHVRVQGIKSTIEPKRGTRRVDPEWLIVAIALTLYGAHSRIKNTSERRRPDGTQTSPQDLPGGHPWHYVYVHHDGQGGTTWDRLIANAGPGDKVDLCDTDHHDLTMKALTLNEGANGRATSTREDAIRTALGLRKRSDDTLGLSAEGYEAILRAAFALLDKRHGRKLRVVSALEHATAVEER